MAYANPSLANAALALITGTRRIDLCSSQPSTFAAATTTFSLGNATGVVIPASVAHTSGRKVVVPAIPVGGGDVTATGTATHYAITDGTNLLVAQTLASSKVFSSTSDTFSLASFDIAYPDPA